MGGYLKRAHVQDPFWTCPRLWAGEVVAILGGGPSLRDVDLSCLKNQRVIAVNSSLRLWPAAQFLMFYDRRWYSWNKRDVDAFAGQVVTGSPASRRDSQRADRKMHYLERVIIEGGLAEKPTEVTGLDSGMQAINLAFHLGARRIVICGFDMRFAPDGRSHWHPGHPIPAAEGNYQHRFTPQYRPVFDWLAARGVELVHGTPGSALDFIPYVPLAEAVR